jgi:DNA replication protein DnaC
MLNNQTLQTLRSLKLTGMADSLEQQLSQPSTHEELGFEERLALLVDREITDRHNNKISRLLKAAKLKLQAHPEDIDYRHPRDLNKSQFADLLSSQWIHQHHNVLMSVKPTLVVCWPPKRAATVCRYVTCTPPACWQRSASPTVTVASRS